MTSTVAQYRLEYINCCINYLLVVMNYLQQLVTKSVIAFVTNLGLMTVCYIIVVMSVIAYIVTLLCNFDDLEHYCKLYRTRLTSVVEYLVY